MNVRVGNTRACSKNIFLVGPHLAEKARDILNGLGNMTAKDQMDG